MSAQRSAFFNLSIAQNALLSDQNLHIAQTMASLVNSGQPRFITGP